MTKHRMPNTRKRNILPIGASALETATNQLYALSAGGSGLKTASRYVKGRKRNPWEDDTIVVASILSDPYTGDVKKVTRKDILRFGKVIQNSDFLSSSNKMGLIGSLGLTWSNIGSGKAIYRYSDLLVPRASPSPLYEITRDDLDKYFKESEEEDKRNPGTLDNVESLSKDWHGRDIETITEVEEKEHYQEDLAELAELQELGVLGPELETKFVIRFHGSKPSLCATDEHNLEIVGGDQSIKIEDVGVERNGKKLVPLGYSYNIVYKADKHHLEGSSGYPELYSHYWGEEFYKEEGLDQDNFTNEDEFFDAVMEEGLHVDAIEEGILPMVVYNKTDDKILLVGGKYTVKDVGIVN